MSRVTDEISGPLPLAERVRRIWRPSDLPAHRAALALYRLGLACFGIGLVALPIAAGVLALNLLSHRALIPWSILPALIALSLLPLVFRRAVRIVLAIQRGYWTRRGIPVTRNEEPQRYWFWTAVEALVAAVQLAAAVYLLLTAVTMA